MRNIKGIALIQILIIVAILSIVAMYVTKSARDQIVIAGWAKDKSEAMVKSHSASNKILFELLTNEWITKSGFDDSELSFRWNFYDSPFELNDNVVINIQDEAGLLNIQYPNYSHLVRRLIFAGIDEQRAISAVNQLIDWQDLDNIPRPNSVERGDGRNAPVMDIREWLLTGSLSEAELNSIKKDLSLAGVGHLNLMNSSKELISALTNEDIAEQAINLRKNNKLTSSVMFKLTQISQDEKIFFSTSNKQKITIKVIVGDVKLNKSFHVELFPYAGGIKAPFNITQYEGS